MTLKSMTGFGRSAGVLGDTSWHWDVRGVNGRALEIQTEQPGWEMELYAATERPPPDQWPSDVWTKVGGGTVEDGKQRFELDTAGKDYRYYLVWITKLPPGEDHVGITQVTLSAPKPDR